MNNFENVKAVTILDSTLRDGAQGAGVAFTVQDKLKITKLLDKLGVDYIEAGTPGASPTDDEFFREVVAAGLVLTNAKLVVFGATRRPHMTVKSDTAFQALCASITNLRSYYKRANSLHSSNEQLGTECADIKRANSKHTGAKSSLNRTIAVTVFGKASVFHVNKVLQVSLDENLAMIRDSVEHLSAMKIEVLFDAEHFFDGYKKDKSYALKVLETAIHAGAGTVVLCDTNGGCLPQEIEEIVAGVKKHFSNADPSLGIARLGIHCHNDTGMAVANTIVGVGGGISHIQGTIAGLGERCGNANLDVLIPTLRLKMGIDCLTLSGFNHLNSTVRQILECANTSYNEHTPYLGRYAFTHKAGMHIDGVNKDPKTFEHVSPELVGNFRHVAVSELSGKAAIVNKLHELAPTLDKSAPIVEQILQELKELEFTGYQFENATASLELMIAKELGLYKTPFSIQEFNVAISEPSRMSFNSQANVRLSVDGNEELTAAAGDGPVNALDLSLRKALGFFYSDIMNLKLVDYKVRVLDSSMATASSVRVIIESTDGDSIWSTIGVSSDVIEASWQALVDSYDYAIWKKRG